MERSLHYLTAPWMWNWDCHSVITLTMLGSDATVCKIWCRCSSLCATDCMIYLLQLVLVQAIPMSYTVYWDVCTG